jgi:hypothetical protein
MLDFLKWRKSDTLSIKTFEPIIVALIQMLFNIYSTREIEI